MGPVDVALALLPAILVIGLLAIPIGAGVILGGLLNAAGGGGAPSWHVCRHDFESHELWVSRHLRARYLALRAAREALDAGAVRYAEPYRPEAADTLRTAAASARPDSASRAAVRGPARIGPVLAPVRASVDRAASPRARRSRGPRASASGLPRKSGRSNRSARPTPS